MKTLDVLAIGAHPDDVELGCGGTVAKLVAAGHRVGILHLTRGEMGTRGSAEERTREAETAAEILGACTVDYLDCGDGGLRHGETEQNALVEVLRSRRPDLILGPAPADRHPDHGRAHVLVRESCFYSGLRRRGSGEPFRPGAVFSYMQHDPFTSSLIVDVSEAWPTKERALDAYSSQLYRPDQTPDSGPATKIATPEFRLAVRGRAQHFGMLIGAAFGEPFWNPTPLAVDDPMSLLPRGIR